MRIILLSSSRSFFYQSPKKYTNCKHGSSLQEVWLPKDFEQLAERVKASLPHSVYFKAGIIGWLKLEHQQLYKKKALEVNLIGRLLCTLFFAPGSGTGILSVHPLADPVHLSYPVNGFPHQVPTNIWDIWWYMIYDWDQDGLDSQSLEEFDPLVLRYGVVTDWQALALGS